MNLHLKISPLKKKRQGFNHPAGVLVLAAAAFFFSALSEAGLPTTTYPPRGVAGDLWADIVLGQQDTVNTSAFSEAKVNYATAGTLFNSGGVYVDRSGVTSGRPERLYIWDAGNNRVLGFSDISQFEPNYTTPGYNADIIIGQPDGNSCGCNGDSNYQLSSFSTPFDSWNTLTPPNASELCGMDQRQQSLPEGGSYSSMSTDSQGNLYVADVGNNRVLRYDYSSLASGSMAPAAVTVWGQCDFTQFKINRGLAAPYNNTLNFNFSQSFSSGGGVAVDDWGNLWVADAGNSRVIMFPNSGVGPEFLPSQTATVVLGQPDMNSSVGGTNTVTLEQPIAVRVDHLGNVFVADGQAAPLTGRIVIYAPTSYKNGVPQYTSGQPYLFALGSADNVKYASNIELGPSSQTNLDNLWVTEPNIPQVIMFQVHCALKKAVATKVLLQHSPYTGPIPGTNTNSADNNTPFIYSYPPGNSFILNFSYGPDAVGVDSNNDAFVGFKGPNQEVWRFPNVPDFSTLPGKESHAADMSVLKPPQTKMVNLITSASLKEANGVAVAEGNTVPQVIVADDYRLMYWDIPGGVGTLTNGEAPTGFAGTTAATVNYLSDTVGYGRVHVDNATGKSGPQHLWTTANDVGGIDIQWFDLPLTPWETYSGRIQNKIPILNSPGEFIDWSVNIESGETHQGPYDVMPSRDGNVSYLWVADGGNSRVFRIRDPLGPSPAVDIVIGQRNANNSDCTQQGVVSPAGSGNCVKEITPSAFTLSKPGAVFLDHSGYLYVSDFSLETAGNARLLEYDPASITNTGNTCKFDIAASHVYDRTTSTTFSIVGPQPYPGDYPDVVNPLQVAMPTDDHVMVVGSFGGDSYTSVIPDPHTNFVPAGSNPPWSSLNDFSSVINAATFDNEGNLYTADLDRPRVMIYLQPFASPTPTPKGNPTATPTFSPTPACFTVVATLPPQPGPVSGPLGMSVDMYRDLLYVADPGNNRVEVYQYVPGNTPTVLATFTGSATDTMTEPYDVAVDQLGYVYVAEFGNQQVIKFSYDPIAKTAVTVAKFGLADGIGQLRGIYTDPCGNGNTVYVSSMKGKCYRYDWNTALSKYVQTGHFGSSAALGVPTGLTKIGNSLYVTSTAKTATGSFLWSFAESGTVPPYTYAPAANVDLNNANSILDNDLAIKTDLAGNIYMTSAANGLLLIFAPGFIFQHEVPIPNNPFGVAVNEVGNIYVSENAANGIVDIRSCCSNEPPLCVPPTPTPTPNCCVIETTATNGSAGPLGAMGNVVTSGSILYVADNPNQIQELQIPGLAPIAGGTIALGNQPYGLSVNNSGTTICVGYSSVNQIQTINLSTRAVITLTTAGLPLGVWLDSANNDVYAAEEYSPNGLVQVFPWNGTSYGSPIALLSSTSMSGAIRGIWKNGTRLYVGDYNNSEVFEYDETNPANHTFSSPSLVVTAANISNVCQLWMDGGSNLYVASPGNGEVVEYYPQSAPDMPFVFEHACSTGLNNQGAASDSGGHVYARSAVANAQNAFEVLQFAPFNCVSAPPTATPTNTVTRTTTNTPTVTPTGTFSNTPSPTLSPTLTNTVTVTATYTFTETPSNTPSPTPSTTATNTFTVTPSSTPTQTLTNTPSPSQTDTFTDTPSFTPSATFTNTPTNTNTPNCCVIQATAVSGPAGSFGAMANLAALGSTLYVADTGNQRIQELQMPGLASIPGGTISLGNQPYALSVNNAGTTICVGYSSVNQIQTINLSTHASITLTTAGLPLGVWLDSANNDVYAAEEYSPNGLVQVFPWNGTSYGSPIALLSSTSMSGAIRGIWKNGSALYVGDYTNSEVFEYDETNPANHTFSSPSLVVTAANISNVCQLWMDGGSNLYVASAGNNEVVEYYPQSAPDAKFVFEHECPTGLAPQGAVVDFTGLVYAGSTLANTQNAFEVLQFAPFNCGPALPTATFTNTPTLTPTSTPCCLIQGTAMGGPAGTFKTVTNVAVYGSTLYVGDGANAQIQELMVPGLAPIMGGTISLAGQQPYALSVNSAGTTLCVGYASGNSIQTAALPSGVLAPAMTTTGLPLGVYIDLNNDIYVAEALAPHGAIQVFVWNGTGYNAPLAISTSTAMSSSLRGIWKNGLNLYVGDYTNSEVFELDETTATSHVFGSPTAVVSSAFISNPCQLWFDTALNLYAASAGNGEVVEYYPQSAPDAMFVFEHECSTGQVDQGAAVDSGGTVYAGSNAVNNLSNFEVQQFAPFNCGAAPQAQIKKMAVAVFTYTPTITPTNMAAAGQAAGISALALPETTGTTTPSSGKPFTPTLTATVTLTPTFTPTVSSTPTASGLLLSAVAGPNVSRNGAPIKFMINLGTGAQVQLSLYTLTGEEVFTDTIQGQAGMNTITWLLRNKSQLPVTSGLYIYDLHVGNGGGSAVKTGKVLVFH